MNLLIRIYIIIFCLYVYIGKGIAYTFLSEILFVLVIFGCLVNFIKRKSINVGFKTILLYLLIGVNVLYVGRGLLSFGVFDVIRDSMIIFYALFAVFVLTLNGKSRAFLFQGICKVYKYYPIFILFVLKLSQWFSLQDIVLFGDTSLFYFKYGDISVHLCVFLILLLENKIKYRIGYLRIISIFSTIYVLLIAFSFSRGGMLAFLIPVTIYILRYKFHIVKAHFVKISLSFVLLSFIFYLTTKSTQEDFQGRATGFSQLSSNITSLFVTDESDPLGGNKVWRLVWWGKIVQYTILGPYFLQGKGLGINLALDDDIPADMFDELRSPHNYSMSILARYGVPVFLIWLVIFAGVVLVCLRSRLNYHRNYIFLNLILFAFLINSTFDVYLEGPMAALPFWTFFGYSLVNFKRDLYVI